MALAAGPLRDRTSRPDLVLRRRRRLDNCLMMMMLLRLLKLFRLLLRKEHDCCCCKPKTLTHISWRGCPVYRRRRSSQADPAQAVDAARPSARRPHRRDRRISKVFFFLLLSLSRFRFLRCQLVRPYPAVLSVQNKRKM